MVKRRVETPMRLKISVVVFVLCGAVGAMMHAQAPAAATTSQLTYQAGLGYSYARPDYGDGGIGGFTAFGDVNFGTHFGVEFDYHNTNLSTPRDLGEVSYVGGIRYVYPVRRFRPYARAMAGIGTFYEHFGYYPRSVSSSYKIVGFGGGLEYPLTRHLNLRAIDAEYQFWPHFGDNGLNPFVITSGLAYRF